MKRFAVIAAIALIATAGAHAEYVQNGDFAISDTTATNFGWRSSAGYVNVVDGTFGGYSHPTALETYHAGGAYWNTGWQLIDVPIGNWLHIHFEVCAPNNSGKGKINFYSVDSGYVIDTNCLDTRNGYVNAYWHNYKYTLTSGYNWTSILGTNATGYTITQNWGRMHNWRRQDFFIQSRGQILIMLVTGDKQDLTGGGYPDNNGPNYWDNVSVTDYPSGRLNGDADLDGDVDDLDLLTVFGNFTGTTGVDEFNRMTWSNGNFDLELGRYGDGDNDVDNNDLLETMANYTGGSPVPPAGNPAVADLIYDSFTGEVIIDPTDVGGIIGFNLFNAYQSVFVNTPHTAVMAGTYDSSDKEISEADPFGGLYSAASLGNILPTGLDMAAIQAILAYVHYANGLEVAQASWTYVAELGGGRQDFEIIIIPEPATLALLGLGGLGVLLRRRRS